MRQHLHHRTGHTHTESADSTHLGVTQCIFELFTDSKEAVRKIQHHVTRFGQLQFAARPAPQRRANALLQHSDLATDGLRRDMQLLARFGHTARFGHHPKIMKVLVVEVLQN